MSESKEILIVDDRGVSRITIARYLTDAGYGVTQASDCMEALRKLGANPFHLVIIDHTLEKMNAFQFLDAAKALGFLESAGRDKPKFILMSDQIEEAQVREALGRGFQYVFAKSIDRGRLMEIIETLVRPAPPPLDIPPEDNPDRERTHPTPTDEPERRQVVGFFKRKTQDGAWYFQISGTLSKGSGFRDLTNAVSSTCDGEGSRAILDLSQVSYINSTGIGGLMSIYKQLQSVGGNFKLVNAQNHVVQVLDNLDLLKVFDYEEGFPSPFADPLLENLDKLEQPESATSPSDSAPPPNEETPEPPSAESR